MTKKGLPAQGGGGLVGRGGLGVWVAVEVFKQNTYSGMWHRECAYATDSFVCLFDLILYVPVNNLCYIGTGLLLSKDQGHNTVTPVKLGPAALQSRVYHSNTKYFLDLLCAKIGKIAVIIILSQKDVMHNLSQPNININIIGNLSTVFTVF